MDKLLHLLSKNSQFTVAELSAMLGESEETISARIGEYERKGIIKGYQAVVNWEDVGRTSYVEALIELKVAPKKETGFDDMAKLCMAFDEVEAVYLMAGVYRGETMQDIGMFVAKKLSTIDGVLSTGTHFIMRRYKDRGINLFDADNQADERSLIL